MNEDKYEIKVGDSVFTFGGPCPPIQSQFFPNDKSLEQQENIGDQDDSSQST